MNISQIKDAITKGLYGENSKDKVSEIIFDGRFRIVHTTDNREFTLDMENGNVFEYDAEIDEEVFLGKVDKQTKSFIKD